MYMFEITFDKCMWIHDTTSIRYIAQFWQAVLIGKSYLSKRVGGKSS